MMKKPVITLTLEEVLEKGKAAFIAGELSCQDTDPDQRQCKYRTNNNRPCIIGAALSEEQGRAAEDWAAAEGCDTGITIMVTEGVFKVEDGYQEMTVLQDAHDQACVSRSKADEEANYLRLAELLGVPTELIPERKPAER
jgi:hypothetical protein